MKLLISFTLITIIGAHAHAANRIERLFFCENARGYEMVSFENCEVEVRRISTSYRGNGVYVLTGSFEDRICRVAYMPRLNGGLQTVEDFNCELRE